MTNKHPLAGEPYRPSNGSEGDCFQSQWCANCSLYVEDEIGKNCSKNIILMTMSYEPEEKEYPEEWTHDNKGQPICTAWIDKDPPASKPARSPHSLVNYWGTRQSYSGAKSSIKLTSEVINY